MKKKNFETANQSGTLISRIFLQTPIFATALVFGTVGFVQLLVGLDAQGQEIPRAEYLRYIPLKYPPIVRQTEASVEMNLFGDITDPDQDVDPVDGINDHRHKVLLDLAVRFAPYLVLNSTMIPMDFRQFMEGDEAFRLFVDTWNISKNPPKLIGSETINWQSLTCSTSEAGSRATNADILNSRLLSLLEAFDPFAPGPAYRSGAVAPERTEHQVMFFDFPGEGEETWKQEYVNQKSKALPRSYEGFAKVFVHPFVESVRSSVTGHPGYAFVLQYWFFYPYNDGFNNHEGDWEHINVSITLLSKFHEPLSKFHEPLSEADVRRILAGAALDNLVIQRVDYYFHHKVMTLDYTRPNVYQSREKWERELTREERSGEKWIWEQVRYRAYWDDDEMKINTHPIGFIGGDNKGVDQLLEPPGGSNRVSNGTYPFSGVYKNVGPAGATEQISKRFDHRKHFAAGDHKTGVPKKGYKRGSVVGFASPDRIEILPDGERVVNLVKAKAQARRDWAWLVLPIRWGYPATKSPFAGAIAHTNLGNSSVLGPSYNTGWNRSGDAIGFQVYSPHTFDPLLRLVLQDNFFNTLGYLNLPLALLIAPPPIDISWRIISLPFRPFLDMPDRVFQTGGPIPYRNRSFIGMPLSVRYINVDPVFIDLILNSVQTDARSNRQRGAVNQDGRFIKNKEVFKDAYILHGEITLYFNDRFGTQNSFGFGALRLDDEPTLQEFVKASQLLRSIEFYEYSGSIRYNLKTGSLMVFLKGGYGWNVYRLWHLSIDNAPFVNPDGTLVDEPNWERALTFSHSHWLNKPNWKRLSTFLPNTWHFGGGVEGVLLRRIAPHFDLGIRGEVLIYRDSLRINVDTVGPNSSGVPFTRYMFNLGIMVSF